MTAQDPLTNSVLATGKDQLENTVSDESEKSFSIMPLQAVGGQVEEVHHGRAVFSWILATISIILTVYIIFRRQRISGQKMKSIEYTNTLETGVVQIFGKLAGVILRKEVTRSEYNTGTVFLHGVRILRRALLVKNGVACVLNTIDRGLISI